MQNWVSYSKIPFSHIWTWSFRWENEQGWSNSSWGSAHFPPLSLQIVTEWAFLIKMFLIKYYLVCYTTTLFSGVIIIIRSTLQLFKHCCSSQSAGVCSQILICEWKQTINLFSLLGHQTPTLCLDSNTGQHWCCAPSVMEDWVSLFGSWVHMSTSFP